MKVAFGISPFIQGADGFPNRVKLRGILFRAPLLTALSILGLVTVRAQIQYVASDLGSFQTLEASSATAVNSYSQFVANSSHYLNAFEFSGGTLTDLPPATNIFPSTDVVSMIASGINDSGVIVGYVEEGAGLESGFIFSNGIYEQIGAFIPSQFIWSFASAINSSGSVVGREFNQNDNAAYGFLYSNGSIKDLYFHRGFDSFATAINASGQVAGCADSPSFIQHAFIYSGGVMTDLGTLGGGVSYAYGINDQGQVVGDSATSTLVSDAFLYSGGVMRDLGGLVSGRASAAHGINNSGLIVGIAGTVRNGANVGVAMRYSNGTMMDLNMITDLSTSGFSSLDSANAVNNAGVIVGSGTWSDGSTHAFLLLPVGYTLPPVPIPTPTPTPTPTPKPTPIPTPTPTPIQELILPAITAQPANQSVVSGASAAFWVAASGTPVLSYQWSFNGAAINGAISPILIIADAQSSNAGSYEVTVTNAAGSVLSAACTLAINSVGNVLKPTIAREPSSQTLATGSTVVFAVELGDSGSSASASAPIKSQVAKSQGGSSEASTTDIPSYQWFWNGVAEMGSSASTLVVNNATLADAGSYACLVTNAAGSVVTAAATLNVIETSNPGRLINISCRSQVGTGADQLITGFVVGGQGTSGTVPLLIRASGPALVPFGVAGVLADPQLTFNDSSTVLAKNDGWDGNAQISSTASSVGAFVWNNASSHDSGLVELLEGGSYTAQVFGFSGDTGVALAEVYDATSVGTYKATSPRLINVSTRVKVGTGENILIAGFVIGGTTSKTVLIRASGPALVPFGVSGILPDPQLQLNNSSKAIATNIGWGGSTQIAEIAATVGAFSWGTSATPDSAVLVTLPPGAYTAQVSGASGDTGVALIEVYEVP